MQFRIHTDILERFLLVGISFIRYHTCVHESLPRPPLVVTRTPPAEVQVPVVLLIVQNLMHIFGIDRHLRALSEVQG